MIKFALITLILYIPLLGNSMIQNYKKAESFLPANIVKLLNQRQIKIHWIGEGNSFWYMERSGNFVNYKLVHPSSNRVSTIFNEKTLKRAISSLIKRKVNIDELTVKNLKLNLKKQLLRFNIGRNLVQFNFRQKEFKLVRAEKKRVPNSSPNGKWHVFQKKHNLYLKNLFTGKVKQLTEDGEKFHAYGSQAPNYNEQIGNKKPWLHIFWSPDSRKFATARFDFRNCEMMHLIKTPTPQKGRPELISFPYPMPVDDKLPTAELFIYNINKGKLLKSNKGSLPITWYFRPLTWYKDSRGIFFIYSPRGFREIHLKEMDAETGTLKNLITEKSIEGPVDPTIQTAIPVKDGKEFIWSSEGNGWNHLYLYDGKTGKIKNQISAGNSFVRNVNHIDEKNRRILYSASSKDPEEDPYYRYLYEVSFDGQISRLITKEKAEHSVSVSPDGKYFTDTISRHNLPPVTILKEIASGKSLRVIFKSNIEKLLKTGWKFPQRFRTTAADGKTQIYGLIYKPRNFDPQKRYPVIDKIYTGPHNFFTPTSFEAFKSEAWSFTELGFVVVETDGRGTGKRSRKFHNFSYKNLGRGPIDHVAAIKKLGKTRRWMDLSRVGIYGFSAGGYDTVRGMLMFPQFYKVGVAASGNHDHRMDKSWWNELWMGYPMNKHYEYQSNIRNAHKLKGKLMLAHGELDSNVHPASTLALVKELIKHNKDFEFLIIPGAGHYLHQESPYFVRKRWDFFVKHLLGLEPPKNYKIGSRN